MMNNLPDFELKQNQTYTGNPQIRACGVKLPLSEEHMKEYIKCSRDYVYFMKNYVKIFNTDGGIIHFEMWPFQEKMINMFHDNRFSLCKLPRQSGKTTTVGAYILWLAIFAHPDEPNQIAILAHTGDQAREILSRIQLSFENLPFWLQQGIKEWNKGSIEFENGSKIRAMATSARAARGGSYNLLYLDEFAFVQRSIQEEFYVSAYPTLSSGKTTKMIITSTPKGLDYFYKIWKDSEEGRNKFSRLEIFWNDIPGRDDAWKAEQIANMGERYFSQEFETEFLGSSDTLISGKKLAMIPYATPIHSSATGFNYYEEAKPGRTYITVVDTARGVGLDYSAFVVFDATESPYRVVCTYRNNEIQPIVYPKYIYDAAKYYNNSQVLIETNDLGQQIVDIMHEELEYEGVIATHSKNRKIFATMGFGVKSELGVRTTKSVKSLGCSTLKSLVEDDKLIINDFNILDELAHFILKGMSYQAEDGSNDDLAMCCVLFAWLTSQSYFKDMTNHDVIKNIYDQNVNALEENLVPFGYISDGREPEYESVDGDLWKMG